MFNAIFKLWMNPTDTPSILIKLNLWSFINIRFFKVKLLLQMTYFITLLNNLKIKTLLFFYKTFSFDLLFFNISIYIFLVLVTLLLFI